ncbi:MAG: hypothetical protein JW770_03510 [Actinobacteria bacterium]|nr:hypothetical protein [Actinomycetota bacterium]
MSKMWLEVFLGKIGTYIIGFIADYYYFIIAPVIVYGIFMTISSYNLRRMEKAVNGEIIRQARAILKDDPGINYVGMVDGIAIDWKKMIKKYSFFPFVSRESDLWVCRTGEASVRNIIMHDNSKIRLVLGRNGIHFAGDSAESGKNFYTVFINRITRRK